MKKKKPSLYVEGNMSVNSYSLLKVFSVVLMLYILSQKHHRNKMWWKQLNATKAEEKVIGGQ